MRDIQENSEKLVFEKGKFVLTEVEDSKVRAKLGKDPRWKSLPNDSYTTDDLGAAKIFRKYADERAEKLFKRTFQEHYPFQTVFPLYKEIQHDCDKTQLRGLVWVLTRKRSYLAHAPGAGKTAIAILASCLTQATGQTLFIVPPGLTTNWEREICKFSPWAGNYGSIAIVSASKRQSEMDWAADFIICPDSMLTKEWVYENLRKLKKKFIAVDEASRFKEPYAERSIALYGGVVNKKIEPGISTRPAHCLIYPGLFQNAHHIVLLDGSPMPNRPIELWAPTYALHPEAIDCRDYDDFGYRYCGAKPNDHGQWEYLYSSNEEELKTKLQKDFMQVVTEGELEHPERRRSMLFMDKDVRSVEHKKWEKKNLKTTKFEDSSQGEMAHFRKELGIRKVKWIGEYVKWRLKEKNESILLFVWHREVAEKLCAALLDFDPGMIIGGTSVESRAVKMESFQNGKSKLLILNIAAGGRGYNLQRADRVIFGEWSWTDEVNKQAEKRASRKGSDKEFVRCEYIVAPNSMDEIVLRSVFTKEKRVERVIG